MVFISSILRYEKLCSFIVLMEKIEIQLPSGYDISHYTLSGYQGKQRRTSFTQIPSNKVLFSGKDGPVFYK